MVDTLKNMIETVPAGALLGLDVGAKTIGVALSDPDKVVATPLTTIKRVKFSKDVAKLADLVREYEIKGFVVGLPVNMDDTEGRRAQSVRDFCLELRQREALGAAAGWIALWDERLSTKSVEDIVDNFVGKKSKRRNAKDDGLIDKLAAQLILQGALDFISQGHSR